MPSWPTAFGGMLAAGYAASQAQKAGLDSPAALVTSALKTLGSDAGGNTPLPTARSSGSELIVLQGEVERLHKLLADVVRGQKAGGGYTVIHTGRGNWGFLILPAAVAGGAFYLYVKVRGITVSDFFMVTNKSLQQFRDLVSQSMTQLWEEVRKQKDEFIRRIAQVGEQQQALMSKQNDMDEKLASVHNNVENIREVSESIDSRVGEMDHTIKSISMDVKRTNEGIYLLCATVADVTRRIGMDSSTSKLKTFVQAAPPLEITDSNSGLRTLLEGISSSEQPAALSTSTSLLVTPSASITELPADDCGEGLAGSDGVGLLAGRGGGANRGMPDEIRVMYRRDSVPLTSSASGRGFIGAGLWSGGNVSGNRSRQVANGH